MIIFGEFENETATVTVDVYNSSNDVKVVDNASATHTTSGLYKYNFSGRDSALNYYVIFKNTTDNTTAVGSINSDLDISSVAKKSDIDALNDFDPATDTVANVTLVATTTTNTDMITSDKMTSAELHSALDSYQNKDDYKATGYATESKQDVMDAVIDDIKSKTDTLVNTDISTLATTVDLTTVNDNVKDASLLIPAARNI